MSLKKPTPFSKLSFFFIIVITFLLSPLFTPPTTSQPPRISARSLDSLLQDYAFRAVLVRPKTGVVFDADLPENFAGVKASAIRLRSGSLRTRGVKSCREFQIPIGVVQQPYSKRIVLVYHNLGNFSSLFYPLPGFKYMAPVLGLLAYDASNLSAKGLPELEIRATEKAISVQFSDVEAQGRRKHDSSFSPRCVYFDLYGSAEFDELLPGNVCNVVKQGHFSVVVESTAPSPAPAAGDYSGQGGMGGRAKSKTGKIVGSLVGLLVILVAVFVVVWKIKEREKKDNKKWRRKKKMQEEETERGGEALQMTSFGNIRAPFATVTRTQPFLEHRYWP